MRGGTALLAACALALMGAAEAPEPGAGFDVVAYELALTPDVAGKSVSGHETVRLRATADALGRIAFSANALAVDGATLDGAPVAVRREGTAWVFTPIWPLARGQEVALSFRYAGRPARGVSGSGASLYTSYFACDWMVCVQDAFGDKALFRLALTVPPGMDAVAAGRKTGRRRLAGRGSVETWTTPRPYPAYLFGFALGRLARAEQRVGAARLAFLSDVATPAELRRRFADTAAAVRFFASRAGVALPGGSYTQLLVTGDEAQEAATYSVLGTDAVPAIPGDPDEDWAVAHELAHQWWGNLVTCASLREFWLNEGITTFMTAAWKEQRYGRAAYQAELDGARRRLEAARREGWDKPLAWHGRYPSLGTRRAVQYGKGALFMDHLRTLIGEHAFWAGLRRYTRAHAGGTVTSDDLRHAMEATSGRDLRQPFAEWVYGAERRDGLNGA